jgi:two-component system OmpR family sensor kinase
MAIRVRLALLFALGTAAVIVIASVGFVHLLATGLLSSTDSSLRSRAAVLGRAAGSGPGSGAPTWSVRIRDEVLAQVFDPSGRMVASSPGAGTQPVPSARQLAAARRGAVPASIHLNDNGDSAQAGEHIRLLASPVAQPDGTWVVVVGESLESNDQAIGRVTRAAAVGGPPAVLFAGLAAWLLAAAALRPVERMRRQVAEISEHDRSTAIEVPRTGDEIAALAVTLNRLLARLQQALDRERGFVADAGHELRSPLAVLQAELELASRPGRSLSELTDAVTAAAGETDRLVRLAEDLLVLARSDDGAAQLRYEPAPVDALLAAALAGAQVRADGLGVALELVAGPDLEAEVDTGRVRQAVDNLVDNALRHAPRGSSVRLSAFAQRDDLVIEVQDDGDGFPPEFLPHAFERFRRAEAARTRDNGGAGLGLAIVWAVVRAHHGRATAENRPGGGATVRIELPFIRPFT